MGRRPALSCYTVVIIRDILKGCCLASRCFNLSHCNSTSVNPNEQCIFHLAVLTLTKYEAWTMLARSSIFFIRPFWNKFETPFARFSVQNNLKGGLESLQMIVLLSDTHRRPSVVFDRQKCHSKQLKLWFEIITGTQLKTLKSSLGSAVE